MINKEISKIFIASDHRGVGLKLYLNQMLSTAGYEVVDLGTNDHHTMVDYADVVKPLADALLTDINARGIVICGSGAGVEIASNRYRHIRATRCFTPEQATEDRFHMDTNVLALASDNIDIEMAFVCAEAFLTSPFEAIERRINRIKKIS